MSDFNPAPSVSSLFVEGDPYAHFAQMREQASVVRVDDPPAYVATRFAEAHTILRHPETFSSAEGVGIRHLPRGARRGGAFLRDPPEHLRLRHVVQRAFSPKAIAGWRQYAYGLSSELIERALMVDDELDFVTGVAVPLPFEMIGAILGLDREASRWLLPHAQRIARGVGGTELSGETLESYIAVAEHVAPILRGRVGADGVLGALTTAVQEGIATEEEALDVVGLIIGAGSHTTVGLLSNVVNQLLEDPALAERLRRQEELVRACVAEAVRFDPPVQGVFRTVTAATTLGDHDLRPGDRVCSLIASANRDPLRFEDPDRFLLRAQPPKPLSFSAGVHHCLGSGLAMIEAEALIATLLRQTSRLERGAQAVRTPPGILRGFSRMDVRLTGAA